MATNRGRQVLFVPLWSVPPFSFKISLMYPDTDGPGALRAQFTPKRRIMMVAGEASGDLHGGDLAARIIAGAPGCEIFGIAGRRMRAAGVRALINTEDIAGLGFTELASTIRRTLGAWFSLRSIVVNEKPDLLILIDYAEFNMTLARSAKRAGVPVLYYILPQVWAWRRGRIGKIIKRADQLATVLPFERELFAAAGSRVTFVGHPLLDHVAPAQDKQATMIRHGLPPSARLLALLPGSRREEVRHLLPPMIGAARLMARRNGLVPVLILAPTLTIADLRAAASLAGGASFEDIRVIDEDAYSIIAASEVALTASGTATLETALLGCPMVIAYKMSPVTYGLARMLVRGVENIGMPNILAGRRIVPELIQGEVTADNLAREAEPMLCGERRTEVLAAIGDVRARLGSPGAAARVADIALQMMK